MSTLRNPVPVERWMATDEELQIVEPDEPDEAVAGGVRGQIDELILR